MCFSLKILYNSDWKNYGCNPPRVILERLFDWNSTTHIRLFGYSGSYWIIFAALWNSLLSVDSLGYSEFSSTNHNFTEQIIVDNKKIGIQFNSPRPLTRQSPVTSQLPGHSPCSGVPSGAQSASEHTRAPDVSHHCSSSGVNETASVAAWFSYNKILLI